jgi:4-amino-4-deoxy-L-arabinose transferase-like glycosyltransferase
VESNDTRDRRRPRARALRDAVALGLVAAVALGIAADTAQRFAESGRARWTFVEHDRNAHYLHAIEMVLDAREGDLAALLVDLDRARQWPPLYPFATAATLLVAGVGPNAAVFPSLVAFAACVVLAFVATRRAARAGGNLAGAVAALFVLGSPAYRAYATDVMIESFGAGLTLLSLYTYVRAHDEQTASAWRRLGVALTLLFFTKYNYWLLMALGLGAAELGLHATRLRAALGPLLSTLLARLPAWLAGQLRRPLAWLVAAAVVTAAILSYTGEGRSEVLGLRIAVHGAAEPLHIAWVAATLALIPWWRREGRAAFSRLDSRSRAVLLAHALPLWLYFLLPGRIGAVLGYVGTGNTQTAWTGPLVGAREYASWVASDYHVLPAVALVAVALALAALPACRARVPGAVAAAACFVVGAVLAVLHPNHQPRYSHTWVAPLWMLSGVGAAHLAYGPTGRPARARLAATGLGLVLLVGVHLPGLAGTGRSQGPGHGETGPTLRDVTDAYLDLAAHAPRLAFVTTLPMGKVAKWSVWERRPERAAFAGIFEPGDTPHDTRARFASWIGALDTDAVVLIDAAPDSPLAGTPAPQRWRFGPELMLGQTRFRLEAERSLPAYATTVSVWREATPAAP